MGDKRRGYRPRMNQKDQDGSSFMYRFGKFKVVEVFLHLGDIGGDIVLPYRHAIELPRDFPSARIVHTRGNA